jgi:hypothetical protein
MFGPSLAKGPMMWLKTMRLFPTETSAFMCVLLHEYIRTTTESVQLENKIPGRESQGAYRQDELIGGEPPVVK